MENRDLFTMRELGDRDLEQFNSLLKYAFQVTSDEMLKTGWQEDEMKYSKAPMLKNAFVLGWFHGGKPGLPDCDLPHGDEHRRRTVRDGGITGVATYPEYAGRGLIHSLMSECLQPHAGKAAVYLHSLPLFHSLLPEDGLGSGIG